MDLLKVTLSAVLSVVVLFVITKIIGKRQISQMSMFDYIIGISIGSIAAELATSIEDDFKKPLLAMIIYGVFAVVISIISDKSIKFRTFFSGRSVILFCENKFYFDNMKKSRIDINEFLIQMRNQGYFSMEDVYCAIIEPNGKISIIPRSCAKPLTPKDMNLNPTQDKLLLHIISDGQIMQTELKRSGKDEKWLESQLKNHGVKDIKNIFLATLDDSNNLYIYEKKYTPKQ